MKDSDILGLSREWKEWSGISIGKGNYLIPHFPTRDPYEEKWQSSDEDMTESSVSILYKHDMFGYMCVGVDGWVGGCTCVYKDING